MDTEYTPRPRRDILVEQMQQAPLSPEVTVSAFMLLGYISDSVEMLEHLHRLVMAAAGVRQAHDLSDRFAEKAQQETVVLIQRSIRVPQGSAMTPQELAELNLAVAKALFPDKVWHISPEHVCQYRVRTGTAPCEFYDVPFQAATDRKVAMLLLEEYRFIIRPDGDGWACYREKYTPVEIAGQQGLIEDIEGHALGPTPCIAICRSVVELKGKS